MTVDDLELLRVELDLLWGLQENGCLRTGPRLALAVSVVGGSSDRRRLVAVNSDVPAAAAAEIGRLVDGSEPTPPEEEPAVLSRCAGLLGDVHAAPFVSFLIPPDLQYVHDAPIVRSDGPVTEGLREANPGNWEEQEWLDLLAGRLGPWAMAVENGRIASICHTPAFSEHAVEAGVWTDPDFRGRGYAAAVTAAWQPLVAGRIAFYSAAAQNHSSRQVAARLGLRCLGWVWKLVPTAAPDAAPG